ncbi:MAG TPA: molybdopterin converting factor subunit 1 [Rhodanobacteraceae bacterium]|nr:molybdopterin converting factor subunit 1 [Rhodanobacteraceae bacterium]
MIITLRYFASLRDAAGCADERMASEAPTPRALYAQAVARHGFTLPLERLRVAVNGDFADADTPLRDGDEVAFLPPVSGG